MALLQLESLHRGTLITLKLKHLVCCRSQHARVAEGKVEGGMNSFQWQLEVRLKCPDFRSGQLCADLWAEQQDAGCVSLYRVIGWSCTLVLSGEIEGCTSFSSPFSFLVQKEKPCGPIAAQQVGALSLRSQVGRRRVTLHAVVFQVLT